MTEHATSSILRGIEARLNTAKRRQWIVQRFIDRKNSGQFDVVDTWTGRVVADEIEREADADLIAHAPADIAYLLDMVEKLDVQGRSDDE